MDNHDGDDHHTNEAVGRRAAEVDGDREIDRETERDLEDASRARFVVFESSEQQMAEEEQGGGDGRVKPVGVGLPHE